MKRLNKEIRELDQEELGLGAWTRVALNDLKQSPQKAHMADLVGDRGMSAPRLGKTIEYLSFINNLATKTKQVSMEQIIDKNILETDLGAFMDHSLLSPQISTGSFRDVIEISGGYGRLAEAIYNNTSNRPHSYILTDPIPSSIAAAHAYLTANLTDINIEIVWNNREIIGDDYEGILIVPSWNLTSL